MRRRKRIRFRLIAIVAGLVLGTYAAGCYEQARWDAVLSSDDGSTAGEVSPD
ncbi:hypothetical protein [Mucisphaera sp.]|uniref:hypothetical protein n=1 Tax=Mucisphaera sp. TaxID=2913024 RepID=UPI003D0C7F43